MSSKEEISLKAFDLRHTDCRQDILNAFLKSHSALSHGDLETIVDDKFDRVTIYRTLKTFLEKGLIHKILDADGATRYALCKKQCSTHSHHHDHVHFKCSDCGDTTCIESVNIPAIALPNGYKSKEINLLIEGRCPNCQKT